jgi:hypothetical protein
LVAKVPCHRVQNRLGLLHVILKQKPSPYSAPHLAAYSEQQQRALVRTSDTEPLRDLILSMPAFRTLRIHWRADSADFLAIFT